MMDSFVFYSSFYEALQEIEDPETRLAVYDAIAGYALTGKEPELKGMQAAMFRLIRPQIDANNRRREYGMKGGRPKIEKPMVSEDEGNEKPMVFEGEKIEKPMVSKKSENKKPNVNVNVNVNANVNNIYTSIIQKLNAAVGASFSDKSSATRRLIDARVHEGYKLSDFERVIANKAAEWRGTEFEKFLRPQTLFGTKFESYLNQREPRAKPRASGYEREYAEGELEGLVENAIDAILEHWEGEEKKGGVPIGEQGH